MKQLKYILLTASVLLCGTFFTACSDDNDTPTFPEKTETVYDMSGFVRGADVSWLTEMEVPAINSTMLKVKNKNACHCYVT